MTVLKADKVSKALKKKGFVIQPGRTDHCRFIFYADGYPIKVKTYMSRNGQEIGNELQSCMVEQLHLSKTEFAEMISCEIGHDELLARYAALGILPKD
ncbi:hypothetical protein [Methanorbis rubei]|uniref:Type II toxin-antitoxin system HicA family toxin n=1 Tax=Methanorbis rubei TaxID=3028300 RepID=A0AAE4SD01_9EURY|nr:hypothetical protein [Methanocorpusculaceae archaeon Cs1]